MKKAAILITMVLGGCSSGYDSVYDCYSTSQLRKFSSPSFSSYIMNVRSGDQSRIDIYIQMPYRNIRFEKTADGFRASYSMTFIIRDKNKVIVQTKEVSRPIMTKTYEETVSPRLDFHFQSFTLIPNDYNIEVVATDNLSQLRYKHLEMFKRKSFAQTLKSAYFRKSKHS